MFCAKAFNGRSRRPPVATSQNLPGVQARRRFFFFSFFILYRCPTFSNQKKVPHPHPHPHPHNKKKKTATRLDPWEILRSRYWRPPASPIKGFGIESARLGTFKNYSRSEKKQRHAWTPGRFCEVATGALRLLPLKALAQKVQD